MWVSRSQALLLPDGRRAVTVEEQCRIGHKRRCPMVEIEAAVCIGEAAEIEAERIGMGTFIGKGARVRRTSSIGRFVTIGEYSVIGAELPAAGSRISTSYLVKGQALPWYRDFIKPGPVYAPASKKKLEIGNDVYIGPHSVVTEGVSIGDGAVLLPGTAALSDIPAYTVVYGNPARTWEYRFERSKIERLQKIRWWDYGGALLEKAGPAPGDIEGMLDVLEEEKQKTEPAPWMEMGMRLQYRDGFCRIYSKWKEQVTLLYQFPENG